MQALSLELAKYRHFFAAFARGLCGARSSNECYQMLGESNRIDLEAWAGVLETLLGSVLPESVLISARPDEFFNDYGYEAGYPAGTASYPNVWEQRGVIIYFDSAAGFTFDCTSGRWTQPPGGPYQRIFWISETGVLGEVDENDLNITPIFAVLSPRSAAEYIALITGSYLSRRTSAPDQPARYGELVLGAYAHFFRYPDDLSSDVREMPWISTRLLAPLIKAHREVNLRWLDPFLATFEQRTLRRRIKGESAAERAIQIEEGEERISWTELALRMSEQRREETRGIEEACLSVAASLTSADVLSQDEVMGLHLHQPRYRAYGLSLAYDVEIGVWLDRKRAFPDFVAEDVNPAAWTAIRETFVDPLLHGQLEVPTESQIQLPSLSEQVRLAYETKALRFAAERDSKRLSTPEAGSESARQLHALLSNRYLQVQDLLSRMPTLEHEVDRARFPLPYFLEAPLLAWERSPETHKLESGLIAFGNLLRCIALLGISEVHARRESPPPGLPPRPELVSKLGRNPSLGDWSEMIDWLATRSAGLPVFGEWLRVMHEQRSRTIQLIKTRNDTAHATTLPSRAFKSNALSQLGSYFDDTVRGLRRNAQVSVLILGHRLEASPERWVFATRDLCSPFAQFRDSVISVPASDGPAFVQKHILARSAQNFVSLNAFFRMVQQSPDDPDKTVLVVYEGGKGKKNATFVAVNDEYEVTMEMPTAALTI